MNKQRFNFNLKIYLLLFVVVVFSSNALAQDCQPVFPDAMCTPPNSFDYSTIQDGYWYDSNTWLNGNIPSAENNSDEVIRISHHVVLKNDNIKLQKMTVLFMVGINSSLTINNGNLYLEGSDSRIILSSTTLRTYGNIEQKQNTFVCLNDVELLVGEEEAGEDFISGQTHTQANFKNDGGYRWLEFVCANVTGNYENFGEDYIINSTIDIGDTGNKDRDLDGQDSGDLKNDKGTMIIRNSEFYIPNGNFQNSAFIETCDTRLKLDNGDLQNSGSMSGGEILLWSNDVNIQNQFIGCQTPVVVGPDERIAQIDIKVFQNPLDKGSIKVKINNNNLTTQIEMFDIRGVLVFKTATDKNQISIPSADLNSGVYIIHAGNNNKVIKKIMIQ